MAREQVVGVNAASLLTTPQAWKRQQEARWKSGYTLSGSVVAAIRDQVEKERRKKISESKKAKPTPDKKLSDVKKDYHAESSPTKAAKLFNTNRTYVNQAAKLKAALYRRRGRH